MIALLVGIGAPIGLMVINHGGWETLAMILTFVTYTELAILISIILIVWWFGVKVKSWLY